MKSLKGKLILDSGKLAGSDFNHTVVLICHHDSEGAFGLVLNRRSERKMEDVLVSTAPEAVQAAPLFLGGPVQPQILSCLIHESTNDVVTETTILPGLRIIHTLDELLEPTGSLPIPAQLKFFAGYAGWSPGQLDAEMNDGAWLTHPATVELVFDPRPEELWKMILRSKGPAYRLLAEAPDDVSNN